MMSVFSRSWLLPTLALALLAGCREARQPAAQRAPEPFAVAMARAGRSAGTRLTVAPGTVVILDGSESGTDQSKVELTYSWKKTAGPQASIARPNLASTEVRLDHAGSYSFELVVVCAGKKSLPSPVSITVVKRSGSTSATNGEDPVASHSPRTATFALLDSDAEELIKIFAARTGITLRVAPEWMRPEELKNIPVTFMARGVKPDVALEMAARMLEAPYVRDRSDAAFLVRGMGWLRAERQKAHFHPTPGIAPAGRGGKLEALAREACRGALFACKGSAVTYDRRRDGLHVTGPASIHARIESLLGALGDDHAALPERPALTADEKLERATLRRRVNLVLVNRNFHLVGLELGTTLRVPVAWETRAGNRRKTPPRISVRGAGRPASQVLSEVARKGGFKGWEWVAGGGIWFYRKTRGSPSRAHLWKTAEVSAYPLMELKARGILPGAALHTIKKKVSPGSWRNPAALCAYYKHTDKLLVVNSPRVQREVLRALHDLLEEKPNTKKP
jgi:K319L-like, PKD domain